MSKNKNNQTKTRYGVFYKSNGKWIGPYKGKTMTEYTISRKPMQKEISIIKNYILKTKVKVMPVG